MKKLAKRLERAAAVLEQKLAEAAQAAASQAAEEARRNVPVDTGELRESITCSADGLTAQVRADAPYAALVEYGTRRMPPRPFLRPAAMTAQETFAARAREALKEI